MDPAEPLSAQELRTHYDAINPSESLWSEHPDFTHGDWQEEVANGDHLMGYWDWVKYMIDEEEG